MPLKQGRGQVSLSNPSLTGVAGTQLLEPSIWRNKQNQKHSSESKPGNSNMRSDAPSFATLPTVHLDTSFLKEANYIMTVRGRN